MATKKCEDRVIVRTKNAGVFFGKILKRTGGEAVLGNCRRIWFWRGAASLSELATTGTSNPGECKFPPTTENHTVMEVIEIIPVTVAAAKSIDGVKPWRA